MASVGFKRKLTAILSADAKDYSRLMGEDEAATVQTNMSGDPEQEYFSDGITEDVITDLFKISGLWIALLNW